MEKICGILENLKKNFFLLEKNPTSSSKIGGFWGKKSSSDFLGVFSEIKIRWNKCAKIVAMFLVEWIIGSRKCWYEKRGLTQKRTKMYFLCFYFCSSKTFWIVFSMSESVSPSTLICVIVLDFYEHCLWTLYLSKYRVQILNARYSWI